MLRKRLFGAVSDTRGSVAAEGAIVFAAILIVVLGFVDFGFYISRSIELEQAVRAGGQYAMKKASDDTTIALIVDDSSDLDLSGSAVTVSDPWCECSTDPSFVCGDTCSGDDYHKYITITAETTFNPIFVNFGFFTPNMTLSEDITVRLF